MTEERHISAHDARNMLAEWASATRWSKVHATTIPPHLNSVACAFTCKLIKLNHKALIYITHLLNYVHVCKA